MVTEDMVGSSSDEEKELGPVQANTFVPVPPVTVVLSASVVPEHTGPELPIADTTSGVDWVTVAVTVVRPDAASETVHV